jgi:hypothetical protein
MRHYSSSLPADPDRVKDLAEETRRALRYALRRPAPAALFLLAGLHCLRAGGAGEHQAGSDCLLGEKGPHPAAAWSEGVPVHPDTLSERTEQMTRRRVDQGYTEVDSRTLLAELLRTRGAGTLASALCYDGFATALGAEGFAADYFEPHPDVESASRPALAVVAGTVEHSGEGTLVYGTSRDDRATIQALKDNGFRWSRRLEAWHLPRNLTHDTRDRKVAGLQAALGKRVVVEVPDGGRRLTAAEQEATRQERAAERANRMTTRAERLTARAEAHRAAADRISENIPIGQPILVGHHSEARARRDANRIRSNMDKSIEAAAGAEAAQAAADRAERTATGSESVVTITNRIERNEALVRKVDRELAAHATAQGIIDKLGADLDDGVALGLPRCRGRGRARAGLRGRHRGRGRGCEVHHGSERARAQRRRRHELVPAAAGRAAAGAGAGAAKPPAECNGGAGLGG